MCTGPAWVAPACEPRAGKAVSGQGEVEIRHIAQPHWSALRLHEDLCPGDRIRLGRHSRAAVLLANRTLLRLDADTTITFSQVASKDPTPYLYDAVLKQTTNRPVEALRDLQKSIELNDNRAVYRSRLLLDQDLAARSVNLSRIYDDLGFDQRALLEGWRSVNTAPGNYSAHRFLADLYAALPRHEIARVSELLQSQLLQPLNVTPLAGGAGRGQPCCPGVRSPLRSFVHGVQPPVSAQRYHASG